MSAAHLAQLTRELEVTDQTSREPERRACATGSILSAVAFLEAIINEFYSDVHDGMLDSKPLRFIGQIWAVEPARRLSTLHRYQLALGLAGHESFETDRQPYQDVAVIIRLRNALVHFNPEWVEEGGRPRAIDTALKGSFHSARTSGLANEYSRTSVLGFGCARWATLATVDFVKAFAIKLGQEIAGWPHLDLVRLEAAVRNIRLQ